MNAVNVHNVYTLQELDENGNPSPTPLLSFFRPQDWGNSSRWHYHQCSIQFTLDGTTYINNCHLYQEIERNSIEAFQFVSEYLFMVALPGCKQELAAKSHLNEDDFWEKEWGDLPPYYEEPDEEYEL